MSNPIVDALFKIPIVSILKMPIAKSLVDPSSLEELSESPICGKAMDELDADELRRLITYLVGRRVESSLMVTEPGAAQETASKSEILVRCRHCGLTDVYRNE